MSIKSRVERLETGAVPEREATETEKAIFGADWRPSSTTKSSLANTIIQLDEKLKHGEQHGSD